VTLRAHSIRFLNVFDTRRSQTPSLDLQIATRGSKRRLLGLSMAPPSLQVTTRHSKRRFLELRMAPPLGGNVANLGLLSARLSGQRFRALTTHPRHLMLTAHQRNLMPRVI
jgi:hypothetical protein